MTRRRPGAHRGLIDTRRSLGDGTLGGRVRIATPHYERGRPTRRWRPPLPDDLGEPEPEPEGWTARYDADHVTLDDGEVFALLDREGGPSLPLLVGVAGYMPTIRQGYLGGYDVVDVPGMPHSSTVTAWSNWLSEHFPPEEVFPVTVETVYEEVPREDPYEGLNRGPGMGAAVYDPQDDGAGWLTYDLPEMDVRWSAEGSAEQRVAIDRPPPGWRHTVLRWSAGVLSVFIDGTQVLSEPTGSTGIRTSSVIVGAKGIKWRETNIVEGGDPQAMWQAARQKYGL